MPRIEYFLVAESCAVDADSGRISLFHVLEGLTVEQLPKALLSAVVVGTLIREPSDSFGKKYEATLEVRTPGDDNPKPFPMSITLDNERTRLLFYVERIPLTAEGELTFELKLEDRHLASHTVPVRLRPRELPPPEEEQG